MPRLNPQITVIMPTHNESGNIAPLIKATCRLLGRETEIIVVDDMSTDGTREQVKALFPAFPRLRLIGRETRGLTSAIKRGIDEASGELVAWMDCDFSHPPELLVKMFGTIKNGEADCAVASRYLPESIDRTYMESRFVFIHKQFSFFLNMACRFFLINGFRDYTSGFIMVRKSVLNEVIFNGDYGEYFMELIVNISKGGFSIVELPYVSEPRRAGKSKTAEKFHELFLKGRKYVWKVIYLKFRLFFGQLP